jgi:hypothetical protein
MRRVVEENEHVRLEIDSERKVICVVRSSSRPAPETFASVVQDLERHLPPDPESWGFVYDARDAPGRNEADWEVQLRDARRGFGRFRCTVILVRSAVGRLHFDRLARDDGYTLYVTSDEAEADSLAAGEIAPRRD